MWLAFLGAAGGRRPRVVPTATLGMAALACALLLPVAEVRAQELRQSSWSDGPTRASSSDLSGETGFLGAVGQWSFGTVGELQAYPVVFESSADGPARSLRAVESASSALDYVGFTACALTLPVPAPECRTMRFFVHRDTTTGTLSLVSVTDGSGTMGCAGEYEANFTTSAGVALVHADEADEVTLLAGSGAVLSAWDNGCADGFILTLPSAGAVVEGEITSRTNLQRLEVLANAAGGVLVDVPLGSLPNNGAAGTPVPFRFGVGLEGSLESAVFALGAARAPVSLAIDAQVGNAVIHGYVRTGATEAAVLASAWFGPFTGGASLAGVPAGAFLQYRVDVTLEDLAGVPGEPEAFARVEEVRIALGDGCDCVIDGQCHDDGEINAANPCERCDPLASPSAWTPADDGEPCDDASFCTGPDSCAAGLCTGGASVCADGLGCTDDACDEAADSCDHVVATGCAIDGACVPSGALNPLDECEVCSPLLPRQWSVAPGCTGCNTGMDCTAPGLGVCDLDDHACVACSAADSSACSDLTPICDAVSRACRGCEVDDECTDPSAPRCSGSGRCVACERHLDCGTDAPICANGDCVVCATSVECFDRDPGAALCNEETGRCGACVDEAECRTAPGGAVCIAAPEGNRCGCTVEADCGVGLTCDEPRQRCFPLATADSDGDGVPDDKDADDDDDGITDLVEGAGANYSFDFDQDGTPNWRDAEAPGFTDTNGDGVDDRSDADRDGVPSQLDLDADGDGVPDTLENAGRDVLDRDRDGRLDDVSDRDRDGLVTTADADDDDPLQSLSVVPVRDTDADGVADFLDHDSDAEGANDTVEAGGTDSDDDGLLDGFSDGNMNGLADRVDRRSGGTALPLPDLDRDGIWDFQDDSDAPRVRIRGGGLCSAGAGGTPSGGWAGWPALAGLLWAGRRRRARITRDSAC